MKKLEKSVPVIRFKGFSEAWEQRKLGEDVNFLNGRAYSQKELLDKGKYKVLRVGNFNTNDRWYYSDLELEENKYANRGDLLYLWATNFGPEIWNQEKVIYHYHIWKLKIMNINVSKQYLYTWLITDKERIKQSTNGTTMVHVTKGHIEQREFQIPPNLTEQQKIGTFFKQLDDTIALHQRKLDTLKLMKKGLLQQMFPKRGENIPKIRFDDFDDIWEQRILGEFLKESKIKGSNGSLAKKLTVKLWRKGVVPKEEIYTGSSATQYYIRKTGQFIYGKLDFLNQAFGIIPLELDGYESTLDSPAFDIEESINETFLLEYVSLARFYKYQGNIANGSRRAKRIHTDTFFEMPIPLPNSNEQQKIGTFSRQIDDLIALQQNKLEKLSSLKRFYLKNMFI
ncbi:restriction endonuclease subunit S [Listeria innocua]|uniref:restriction endonuclease subunit S n=1 Tax=Listeria innocua TaxID=1642 RepID=UPI0010D8667C|nr:restriction endonuclease subunit S [Listeria innocua]ECC1683130.1 restriction endonuclease subunit S [Listeria innocua]EKA7726130.1 restriction endonuclease subunit S [Listeria innocua]EKA7757618.1 restriction endonuclease subunit S [Listeria innocua]EKA7770072.1 restriction endonuclease subunit S [Listeria innocua]EKA7782509.1 restriction endonuclease subunit S [Listeria innocua]